jgi:methyl-accepting chemotaxis protein
VVASEVKSLAAQTARATEEIASQIGAIQIGTTIETISTIAGAISASVSEQQSAIEEIARNIQEAARGTQEVSSNIAGVSQAASETGTTSTFVLTAANAVADQTTKIRSGVTDFFATIKAA